MPKKSKKLSTAELLRTIRQCFDEIKDSVTRKKTISLTDCLMSGLAVFGLKYPSLLQFDHSLKENEIRHNLNRLYHINKTPCDTYLRERLDSIPPELLRPAFTSIFAKIQRDNQLLPFRYLEESYLLTIDGTGYFSSHEIHCEQCCEKHHRDGSTTYYHQMMGAALVHPEIKAVIPLAPEPILKQDGRTKNDCEKNASKRLLSDIRREHPHLKLTVIEDGLASNAPHINHIQSLDMHYILGAKPGDHTFLFDWVEKNVPTLYEETGEKGIRHHYRYINNVPLNEKNLNLQVNFLEYWEIKPDGKKQHFSWVTDFTLKDETVHKIMKGGRARWKIENETFNTLKNQGYYFEHNFGHGKKYLSTNFAFLMLLAFLIDQVQLLSCSLFRKAQESAKSKIRFWEKVRGYFFNYLVNSWEDIYRVIAYGKPSVPLILDTS